MSTEVLERRFAAIGARVRVEDGPWRGTPLIDVRSDRRGEYFDLHFDNCRHPTGLSEARFRRISDVQRRTGGWTWMVRDPEVFGMGEGSPSGSREHRAAGPRHAARRLSRLAAFRDGLNRQDATL